MNSTEAKALLSNFLERIETLENGSLRFPGVLTQRERKALIIALSLFDDNAPPYFNDVDKSPDQPTAPAENALMLNMKALEIPDASPDLRLCFDFGTAMSKVTLIKDEADGEIDDITVLKLGIPGDQQEISESMLVSSVFISNDCLLWFGQNAVDKSREDDAHNQRLDSIKRFLLRDDLHEPIPPKYNSHTDVKVTYLDIVLSYLMFLTWTVNVCVENEDEDYPRNIKRRFAMPWSEAESEYNDKSKEVEKRLRKLLGQAQILADTFGEMLQENKGIPLELFINTTRELMREDREYTFVTESVTEPIGVANTYLPPRPAEPSRAIALLVIDVGAGTSDMALFLFWGDEKQNVNKAAPVKGTSKSLDKAGDYLDKILMEYIISEANINYEHPWNEFIRSAISLRIREYKETLFKTEEVNIYLQEYNVDVSIDLHDFLKIDAIEKFGQSIKQAMRSILENVDKSFIDALNSIGYLTVMPTGGGANLPMIQKLASGKLNDILGKNILHQYTLHPLSEMPAWLKDYPDIESDYFRIAVSLGGARKNLIQIKDALPSTGIGAPPQDPPPSFT